MCWLVSKAKEFKGETLNAQRPTSNVQFKAQKLNVERWTLSACHAEALGVAGLDVEYAEQKCRASQLDARRN
jgi:hypothetical protein